MTKRTIGTDRLIDGVKIDNLPTDTQAELDLKVDKTTTINGQDLSTNRTFTQDNIGDGTTYKQYSQTEKTKLAGIEAGAQVNNISDVNATDLTDGGDTTLHTHDSRYYTESEVDTLLSGKQNSLGYTAENTANKENTTIDTSTTKYPTVNLLKTGLDTKQGTLTLTTTGTSGPATLISNTLNIPQYSGGGGGGDVTASGTLTNDTVILGNGTTSIKSSSKTIVTTLGADDTTIPTSLAVANAISSSGGGDVTGPVSSIDNGIALFNGTTGKIIKDSAKTIVTTIGSDDTTIPTSKAVQDVILTPTQKTDLTDGGDTTLHIHDSRYYTETEVNSLISNVGVNFFTLSETVVLNGNTYQQSCISQTDARYGTSIELTGPTVTGTNIAGGKAVSDAGVISSIPAGPIATHLKVRKISGVADFTFHYEYYKLASDGTETLLGTSSTSDQVHSNTTTEFIVTTILPATTFGATDRLMRKGFFTKVGAGTDPVVGITVEGTDPTYVSLAIPVTAVSFAHNDTTGKQGGTSGEYYHLTQTEHTNATQNASSTLTGLLTSTDWNTFNNKQPAGSYLVTTNNLSDVSNQQTALNNLTAVSGATDEYVLTKDTATGDAIWKAGGGGGNTIVSTTPNCIYRSITNTNATISSNTTLNIGLVNITNKILVNKVSGYFNVTASGTAKIALYSEDGQTKYFEVTTPTISGNGIQTMTLSSETELQPGNYYLGIMSISTANLGYRAYTDTLSTDGTSNVSSEPVWTGTITVTADTIPTTITPTSITYSASKTPIVRLDN